MPKLKLPPILVSIVDSISACHAEDRGSIPRRGELSFLPAADCSPRQTKATRQQNHARSSCPTEQFIQRINPLRSHTEVDKSAEQKNRAQNHGQKESLGIEYDGAFLLIRCAVIEPMLFGRVGRSVAYSSVC